MDFILLKNLFILSKTKTDFENTRVTIVEHRAHEEVFTFYHAQLVHLALVIVYSIKERSLILKNAQPKEIIPRVKKVITGLPYR